MDAHAQSVASRSRSLARRGWLFVALMALMLVALRPGAALADAGGIPNRHALAAHSADSSAPPAEETPSVEAEPPEPVPTEPAPAEPAPSEPTPTDPPPSEEPAPTDPPPTEPAPTEPAPTEPAPTEPAPPADPLPADPAAEPEEAEPVEQAIVKAPAKPAPTRSPVDAVTAPAPIVVADDSSDADDDEQAAATKPKLDPSRLVADPLEQLGLHTGDSADVETGGVVGASASTCGTVCAGVATPEDASALARDADTHASDGADAPPQVRGPPAPFDGPASPAAGSAAAAGAAGGQGSAPDCALRADALGLALAADTTFDLPQSADHAAPATANAAARAPPVA